MKVQVPRQKVNLIKVVLKSKICKHPDQQDRLETQKNRRNNKFSIRLKNIHP
jgi:hypothetical protein